MLYATALQLTQTVKPTEEPLTLEDVKAHLHVDGDYSDTQLNAQIRAARRYVEGYTGRALVEQTFRLDLPGWDHTVVLKKPPLIAVDSIKYYDADNNQQTWAASNYEVDTKAGRILLSYTGTIPSSYSRHDTWQVTFRAGYESTTSPQVLSANIDETLIAALKLIIGDLYENREGSTPLKIEDNPTVMRLLDMNRA